MAEIWRIASNAREPVPVLAELWATRLWERDTRRHPRDLWRAGDAQLSYIPGSLPQSFIKDTPPSWRGA